MDNMVIPQVIVPSYEGLHNSSFNSSIARLEQSMLCKDNKTIIICPTRGLIPAQVVQSWIGLMRPMNQFVIGPIFAIGMEVGVAYNQMITGIINDPNLKTWKYILTIEEDNLPPQDGLLNLLGSIDGGVDGVKYDVMGGLYWTKGEAGMPMCFDDQTEVLTISGWKFFKDVSLDDKIATLNSEGYLEYHNPLDRQQYYYNGELIYWKGQCYDIRVTPDHSVYCSTRPGRPFIRVSAQEVEHRRKLSWKKDAIWVGEEKEWFKINESWQVKMDDWLEFLGYYLSEGCCPNFKSKPGSNLVDIRQNNGHTYEMIADVAERLGFNPKKRNGRVQFTNKIIRQILAPFGKSRDKYVPNYIHNLSSRQIKIFLDALWRGDGSFIKKPLSSYNGKYSNYHTISKKLADDVQILLLKIGLAGTVGYLKNSSEQLRVSVTHRNLKPHVSKKSTREYYSGFVYDLTVPNHTLYIRRNGRTIWSGNCYGDPNEFPKNFIPQVPIPDKIMPTNGLGMGFTLFRMDIFHNMEPPWFRTVQEIGPDGAKAYTQDLWFFENAAKHGYKFACDCRVKVGHLDTTTSIIW